MHGEIAFCNFAKIGRAFSPAFLLLWWCFLELVIGSMTFGFVISCKPPFEKW